MSMNDQIDKLEASIEAQAKRLAETKAKKAKIEARKRSKEKTEERRLETRELILIGAYFKSKMKADQTYKDKVLAGLDSFYTSASDRAVFHLAPIPKSEQVQSATEPEQFTNQGNQNGWTQSA